jgi:hypothetical protein
MRLSRIAGIALVTSSSAAALLLAGCGGSTQVSPGPNARVPAASREAPPRTPDLTRLGVAPGLRGAVHAIGPMRRNWLSAAAKTPSPKVYISDFSANAVNVYAPSGGAPIGSITTGVNGPLGTWINEKGTLYVSNVNNGTVTEYPAGSTTPSVTLTAATGAIGVAVGKKGTVYVPDFGGNQVYAYAGGSTTPTTTVALSGPEGTAVGHNAHVFQAFSPSLGDVERYEPFLVNGVDLGLSGIVAPGDAKLDSLGNLLVGDQIGNNGSVVDVYPPGATSPSAQIPVTHAYKFALDQANTTLYVADPSTGIVSVYSYPSGTPQSVTFSGLSSAYGVSVSPQ